MSSIRRIYLRLPLWRCSTCRMGCVLILRITVQAFHVSWDDSVEALLFVFGIQGTHSIFICSCSAAELSSHLLGHVFTPQKKSPDSPIGFFGVRSLSSLCGPVGFRGVPPHHRPIHLELFQWASPRIYYQLRVLCFDIITLSGCSDI